MSNDPLLQPATHPDKYKTRNDFLHDFCPGRVCAEIGVANGAFSVEILKHNPAKLYLIDPWHEQPQSVYPGDQANRPEAENETTYGHIMAYLGKDPRVVVKRTYSFDAAQEFPDKSLDFAFIDAIHSLPMALADMVA